MSEVVAPEDRRACVMKALSDDTTIQGLTTSPYVVVANKIDAVADPAAIVTMRVAAGGEGRVGWRGAIIERYAIDVFVDEKAADDPPTQADKLTKAIDDALKAESLDTALAGLTPAITDAGAVAKRVTEWADLPEPGPEASFHKSADFDVEFRSTT